MIIPETITPEILVGDIFEKLAELPDESVDCVVTSPPYWGLRDYGVEGQLGLEPTLAEHIDTVVRYCREIRRVLKPCGTFWLNYGDCYATSPNGRSAADTKAKGNDDRTFRDKPFSTVGPIYEPRENEKDRRGKSGNKGNQDRKYHSGRVAAGGYLKPKDLCMVPNRVAIALQDDGWWVRSEIIWAKPNPMPESIKDRPATSHEKIFLLTKAPRYFYDSDAVRVNRVSSGEYKTPDGCPTRPGSHGSIHRTGRQKGQSVSTKRKIRGLPPRHQKGGHHHIGIDQVERGSRSLRNWEPEPTTEQPTVWKIATMPFKAAHFATFPPALAERCIKAGCPEGGLVLDPFGGAGTTGLVANRLQRRSILIELNPEYAEIARNRIFDDAPLLSHGDTA